MRLGDNFLPFAWRSQKPWFLKELLWWVCITVVKRITERWLQKRLGWVFERKYKQRIIFKNNNKSTEVGFAQAPCPALLRSEPRAKFPLTFMGSIWPELGKNQQNLQESPKKLLWAVGWETTPMHGGHLRPSSTFKAKREAYLYNHTWKCNFCYLHSHSLARMGTKHHAEMGLMLVLTTTQWLSRSCPIQGLSPGSHSPTSPLAPTPPPEGAKMSVETLWHPKPHEIFTGLGK